MSPKSILRRLAPVALAVAVIAVPSAARADEPVVIDINPGNVPTTAEGHGDHSCDQVPGDIGSDQDGWVFVLPSDHGDKGEFVSVTATFTDTEGGQHTYTTGDNGGIDDGNGTAKAYIIAPAGWTLTGATAEVTGVGKDAKFNLTHTCVGEGGESPSGSPSPSTSGSGTPGDGTASPGDDELPVTGSSLTVPLVGGLLLAAAGVIVLVSMQRRRIMAMRDER